MTIGGGPLAQALAGKSRSKGAPTASLTSNPNSAEVTPDHPTLLSATTPVITPAPGKYDPIYPCKSISS